MIRYIQILYNKMCTIARKLILSWPAAIFYLIMHILLGIKNDRSLPFTHIYSFYCLIYMNFTWNWRLECLTITSVLNLNGLFVSNSLHKKIIHKIFVAWVIKLFDSSELSYFLFGEYQFFPMRKISLGVSISPL